MFEMYLYIDTVGLAWKLDWEDQSVCLERLPIWDWNKKTHELLLKWYSLSGNKGGAKVFHAAHQDGNRYLKVYSHCTLL